MKIQFITHYRHQVNAIKDREDENRFEWRHQVERDCLGEWKLVESLRLLCEFVSRTAEKEDDEEKEDKKEEIKTSLVIRSRRKEAGMDASFKRTFAAFVWIKISINIFFILFALLPFKITWKSWRDLTPATSNWSLFSRSSASYQYSPKIQHHFESSQ